MFGRIVTTISVVSKMENSEQRESNSDKTKLKIFQSTQKNFFIVGINRSLMVLKYPFNGRILLGYLILILSIICNLMFTVYEAKTFAEYTHSIYMGSLAVLISLVLLITLLNVKEIFNTINDCESLANTNK